MDTFAIIMAMLVAVMLSGMMVRLLPIPVPFIQISFGFVIAAVFERGVLIQPEIFFLLFLPPLLFLDGWRVSKRSVLRESSSIIQLAIGLVFLTVLGVGYLIHWMIPSVPLPIAFAIAAIVSPTDPVAVEAISRRVPIPKRMMAILEGESLFNDASGLVAFRFAVAAAVTGTFSLSNATLTFFWMSLAGVAIGIGLTIILIRAKSWVGHRFGMEPGSDVLLSLIVPFLVYYVAEHVEASGILAAVAAGITMSYLEMSGRQVASVRVERQAVWTMVQFVLNGMMFVLLGEQLPTILSSLSEATNESGDSHLYWLPVYGIVICAGLMLIRLLWIVVSLKLAAMHAKRRGKQVDKISKRFIMAMSVAGVRGAVTLAGVMTLPFAMPDGAPFPARDLAIALATIVLLFSLLIASVSLPALLRGWHSTPNEKEREERDLARSAMLKAALESVEKTSLRIAEAHPDDAELCVSVANHVTSQLNETSDHTEDEASAIALARRRTIERELRLEAVAASRQALYHLARRHKISDTFAREQILLLDMQETRILAGN
jgi:Na+/H+ antiporter